MSCFKTISFSFNVDINLSLSIPNFLSQLEINFINFKICIYFIKSPINGINWVVNVIYSFYFKIRNETHSLFPYNSLMRKYLEFKFQNNQNNQCASLITPRVTCNQYQPLTRVGFSTNHTIQIIINVLLDNV